MGRRMRPSSVSSYSATRGSYRYTGSLQSKRSQAKPRRSQVSIKSYDDDYNFEQPSKCHCRNCKMRFMNKERSNEDRYQLEIALVNVLQTLDDQMDDAALELDELVKIKSISVEPEHLQDCCNALEWVTNRLAALKFRTHLYPIDNDVRSCFGESHKKVLFANYFSSPTKMTVLVYAHVDVVPVDRECWFREPFELNIQDGFLYGRGVTSGKGMVIGWLQAIDCWLKNCEDLPINVKFIVDMLNEVGSEGLQHYVQMKNDFFLDVDYMIFDANSWINTERPVIACALTGWAHFGIEVRGGNKNLESGLAGGLVYEPMIDICHLMNSLVDNRQEINVPRIDLMVKRLTVEEWHLLETADFSTYNYMDKLNIRRLKHGSKQDFLQNRWCKPTLTMHGIQGSDHLTEYSRTLPMLVTGKFSIKLVPDQELAHVYSTVKEYIMRMRSELEIGTDMSFQLLDSCEPTSWSTSSKVTRAVCRAVGDVFQNEPIATSGIAMCLPIASVFRKLVNKPIILLPYSMRVDRHYQENESIEEELFMRHSKVCASLLFELSTLPVKCKCGVIYEYCHHMGVAERLAALKVDTTKMSTHRSILTGLLSRKSSRSRKVKKSFKDYLCLPFGSKNMSKRKASTTLPSDEN